VTGQHDERDRFAERLFGSALGYFDILSIRLGQRLGLYEVLAEGAATADQLAARAGIDARYAREWLEQQATAGIVDADVTAEPPIFSLAPSHVEVLLDGDSLWFFGASVKQLFSITNAFDRVVDAFRTGSGVETTAYGSDSVEGQGAGNRPTFLKTLPRVWLPSIAPVHDRLSGQPPAKVVEVGCGTGWASIAIAKAYPAVTVDGFDRDETSIELARKNAAEEAVDDRVRFRDDDAARLDGGPYDVAFAFECVHDMARPVDVLSAVRAHLGDEGAMLVMDERTRESFTGEPDALEGYLYGWSIFDCLPAGRADPPSAATGTVMRASTLQGYASEAGFSRFDVLDIQHEMFRLYLLRP
jgi:SAM-dependent methyltransferase